jgi:hypothetical protein
MPKIVHSDVCPDGAEVFSLGQGPTVKITKGGSYSTTNPIEVANAIAHPWLTVEADKGASAEGVWYPTLDPKDDALAAENSIAFDPKAVKAAKAEHDAKYNVPSLQLDAGLDQDKKIVDDAGNSKTLAADAAATAKTTTKDKD